MRRLLLTISSLALAGAAFAGQPTPGAIGFQPAATRIAERQHWFHNQMLMPIITVITIFVLALLIWVMVRYNSRANLCRASSATTPDRGDLDGRCRR